MKKSNRTQHRKSHLRVYAPPYPNAARPGYFLRKALDALAATASCLGVCSILLFFFLMP